MKVIGSFGNSTIVEYQRGFYERFSGVSIVIFWRKILLETVLEKAASVINLQKEDIEEGILETEKGFFFIHSGAMYYRNEKGETKEAVPVRSSENDISNVLEMAFQETKITTT